MNELPADFRAFHELFRGAYIHWSELYLGNHTDAEEAVDEAFEQLYFKWSDVLAHENPTAYAWVVVKNRTIDHARARGRRPAVIDTAAFETAALRDAVDPIGELAQSMYIYASIQALPERQHDVVVLQYCLGYSTQETADILGVTPAGVRSTTRYARHRLQRALGLDKEEL
ncbi:sigma-70 family RNA polymerase sigma factor [Streptomyces kasugaensis]|uniref:Sigma-70 family RNA polymerase sigma factor n=1 Tax=Streptomyces kasugaensis TaxID=1946 RepID=A0A4Q9I0S8_STRKA|nr:sigma-70 family RNA polymerase sigma factor [Streptomyces kasugaensis]TBO60210.1 sigma-70 family RNA polymerase sigma factor [Streptomyces kasugaensis]